MQKQRPKHLDLANITLPIPGVVSILHRISGVFLFLALPFLVHLLHRTLSSEAMFENYHSLTTHPLIKLVLLGLLWAYLHHFFAGIRFLMLDLHKGIDLPKARMTAKWVLVISLVLTVILGAILW